MLKNIGVVFGGKSTEHDISVITAVQTINGFLKGQFNIVPVFISKENEWFTGSQLTTMEFFKKKNFNTKKLKRVCVIAGNNILYYIKRNKLKECCTLDCMINCCHGGMGESGELAGLFNICNIPFTTNSSIALGLCMNKVLTKEILFANKLPAVKYVSFIVSEWEDKKDMLKDEISKLGEFPLIVKPCSQGSSIGVKLVYNYNDLKDAVDVAFEFDERVIVEKAVCNLKEFNCSCRNFYDEKARKIVTEVSEIEQPELKSGMLSFEDKYMAGGKDGKSKCCGNIKTKGMAGIKRNYNIALGYETKQIIKRLTKKCFRLFNCSGVVRIDFLYDSVKKKLFINEINAVPGSLAYYFWTNDTHSVSDFLCNLVNCAIIMHRNKLKIKDEYISDVLG